LQRWYASARHYLEDTGQPYWETSYEELMQIPEDDARRRWIIEQLADTFPAFRILDPSAGAQEMLRHRKQAASRALEDKLSNYEDFCRGLIERGLEHHLPGESARWPPAAPERAARSRRTVTVRPAGSGTNEPPPPSPSSRAPTRGTTSVAPAPLPSLLS